jgi:hypothetical protein
MKGHPCPRRHPRPVGAQPGSVLCSPCLRQVAGNLRALPGLHQECLHHVSSTSRRSNPTKVSGSRRQDHVNLGALETRHHILATLESWSEIVVEKRRVAAPDRGVPQLARFLTLHLEWLAAQLPAADFADEVESLVAQLRATIDPDPDHSPDLARECVVEDCGGTITVRPAHGRSAGSRSIECSAGHFWEMHEWLNLRQLMERQRKGVPA